MIIIQLCSIQYIQKIQEAMDVDLFKSLNQDQQFEEIVVEDEGKSTALHHVTFQKTMEVLQEQLNEMSKSKFYKSITVHFTCKSKQTVNENVQHYEKRLIVLKKQLQAEKQRLNNIIHAANEEQLETNELIHKKNKLVIKKIEEEIKYDYIPCIYIQSEKKKPFYGHFTQEFSRKGIGNFVAKVGYRSPFLKYDSLQLNVEWPITKIRKKFYQAAIQWTNPIYNYGNMHFKINSAKEPTYVNIDTEMKAVSLALDKNQQRFQIQLGYRKPFIHQNVFQSIQKQFYLPSQKFSFKYSHILKNTINFGDLIEGEYSEVKAEMAIPFLSQSKFIKLEYNFRKFFDTYWMNKFLDNELLKKFFWKSTFETNFSIASMLQYGRHKYVNDCLQPLDVRGFQAYKKPVPSFLNMKSSFKFNLHNFPVLSQARVLTFLYAQMGLSFQKQTKFSPYMASSLGLGFSLYMNPFAQIQVLLNGIQWQNRRARDPLNFQIRFGIFD